MTDTITPKGEIVRWARERAGLTHEQLARKVYGNWENANKPDEARENRIAKIESLEIGETPLAIGRAKELAKACSIPFNVLLFSRPPELKVTLPRFRQNHESEVRGDDFKVYNLVSPIQARQAWMREHRLAHGHPPLTFLENDFSLDTPAEVVARSITETLGYQLPFASRTTRNTDENLRHLRHLVTDVGIQIHMFGTFEGTQNKPITIDGFALFDSVAPVIFINSRFIVARRTFTLAHELAHLWLGTSEYDADVFRGDTRKLEQHCNAIAANFLMPEKEFCEAWKQAGENPDECINIAQHRFAVSRSAAAYRAAKLDLLARGNRYLSYASGSQADEERPKQENKKGGGSYYISTIERLGTPLIRAALHDLQANRLSHTEAKRLLGFSDHNMIYKLAETMQESA